MAEQENVSPGEISPGLISPGEISPVLPESVFKIISV